MSEPKDVIAEWFNKQWWWEYGDFVAKVVCSHAILAALDDAGYEIRKKVEPSQILVNAFGEPDSIEEVAPNTF